MLDDEKDELKFFSLLCLAIFVLGAVSGGILGLVLARLS
uniref:YtxH-like protein n=1 Tax=Myoviridae sp. ctPkm1 TaxID=2825099 RepID=A0A8S5TYC5_9CAUD|nr:MAG TPA: YtxH-like protein [Myoviridae sp. ctPkm1]